MESKYAHVTNDPAIATAVIATHVVATSSTATPYLEVIAPATLPEGYEFEVEAPDGTSLKVHVPMGGVKEGQAFRVPRCCFIFVTRSRKWHSYWTLA